MKLPGRSGALSASGLWQDAGSGNPLPANPVYNSRTGNEPLEYKATETISFIEGFESGVNDAFEAYITTDNGSGSGGNGGSAAGLYADGYRYRFNGKEQDPEISGDGNQYDYGFRIYDPRIGKFKSVDPLRARFPWNSPYSYAEGDVIRAVDLDGAEHKIVIHWIDRKNEDGTLHISKTAVKINKEDGFDGWGQPSKESKSSGSVFALTETYYYMMDTKKLYKGKDLLENANVNNVNPPPSANYDYTQKVLDQTDNDNWVGNKLLHPFKYLRIISRDANAPDNAQTMEDVNMGMLAFSSVLGAPSMVKGMLKAEGVAVDGVNAGATTTQRNFLQDIFQIKRLKGNADIAAGTEAEAMAIGKAWVNGENVRSINVKGGIGFTDGTRTFRLQWKPKYKMWKANFEENTVSATGQVSKIKDVHMNITDKTAPPAH